MKNLLLKFTKGPGLCTIEELSKIKEFIKKYIDYRDIYRFAFINDPVGLQLESQLTKIDDVLKFKIDTSDNSDNR